MMVDIIVPVLEGEDVGGGIGGVRDVGPRSKGVRDEILVWVRKSYMRRKHYWGCS
jgi:hypothetical protein